MIIMSYVITVRLEVVTLPFTYRGHGGLEGYDDKVQQLPAEIRGGGIFVTARVSRNTGR